MNGIEKPPDETVDVSKADASVEMETQIGIETAAWMENNGDAELQRRSVSRSRKASSASVPRLAVSFGMAVVCSISSGGISSLISPSDSESEIGARIGGEVAIRGGGMETAEEGPRVGEGDLERANTGGSVSNARRCLAFSGCVRSFLAAGSAGFDASFSNKWCLFEVFLCGSGERACSEEAFLEAFLDEAQDALPKENRPAVGERNSFPNSAGHLFFEYLIVVSLKKNVNGNYEPKITYQFPKRENLMRGQREEEERLLQAIPLFCFPDGNEWAPLMECKSETFSFVLTNVDGSRKIGYCRRLLILDEVEKRRQISTAVIYPFMQGLRESPFPAPGKTVTIKSFIPDSGTEQIELTRPLDSHLEHVEFQALLQRLSPEKILFIFASAVLERRIVFLAEELSSLSKCIHAAAALLYPFTWAHTYIPVVPEKLLSTVCCPTPFMVGIQKRYLDEVLDQPMEEVLLVDLCEEKFLKVVGDEEEILPAKLQIEMLSSLPAMNNNIQTPEELNVCVSDAFVQFFVKTIGHYPAHIKWNRSGQGCFQERSFCKAPTSKTTRKFLKKFVKTQMFSLFIQEAEQSKKCVAGTLMEDHLNSSLWKRK
ncbi:hypothetical protein JD844_018589, partial [Phrynosoma platyrhinos]